MEDLLDFSDIIFDPNKQIASGKVSPFFEKVYIVTGSSSGIGKAIAMELAQHGAYIVLASRNHKKLQLISKEILALGTEALVIPTDVTSFKSCQSLIDSTMNHFGRIDGLVNNAGISMRAKFEEVELGVLKKLMKTNFWGAVYCTKAALPHLIQSSGYVIAISSICGITPLPGRTGYAASKHALDGFIETLRTENLDNDLKVLLVHPGFTTSNIRKTALNKFGDMQAETPRNEEKMMSAEEVAEEVTDAIIHHKRDIILTREGKLITWIYKNMPSLADRLLYDAMHKEDNSPV